MSPTPSDLFGEPARKAVKGADREFIPPDESSLINAVAAADVSPGVRQALDSFARTIQAGTLARPMPRPAKQPWWEKE